MHRDVKLGLALGILIIGFAAAFCFPRQPIADVMTQAHSPEESLRLASLDQSIRQQRRRTFIGEELNPPPQPTLAPVIEDEPVLLPIAPNPQLPPLQTAAMRRVQPELSAPDPVPPREPAETLLVNTTGPQPIVMVPDPMPEPAAATSLPSTATPVGIPAPKIAAAPEIPVPGSSDTLHVDVPPPEEELYTVQSGDTLSGIASRKLGSIRKFEQIYEANRDVMSSPNALKVGMVLRIPQEPQTIARRSPSPATPTQPVTSRPTAIVAASPVEPVRPTPPPAEGLPDAIPPRNGLFSPVRRTPLGGPVMQAGTADPQRR